MARPPGSRACCCWSSIRCWPWPCYLRRRDRLLCAWRGGAWHPEGTRPQALPKTPPTLELYAALNSWSAITSRRLRSLLQMIGHTNHNHALAKQQRAFERQRGLIVQQMLPPLRGDELGQDHREHVVVVARIHIVDIAQDRSNKATIGRRQDLQRHIAAPLGPLGLHFVGRLSIKIDVERGGVVGRKRFGELQGWEH